MFIDKFRTNRIWKNILLLILSIFFLFEPETTIGYEQKQITVVFRFDDYSSGSPTEFELKLLNSFKNFNAPVTFGVIPHRLSPMKAAILRENVKSGVLEVALHGYTHQSFRTKTNGDFSEFSGRDYDSQLQIITAGKNLLEEMLGIQISTFIPPWNSYDINTLRVLEKIGFKTISADIHGVTKESSQLRFLPATCSFRDNIQEAVRSARRISDDRPIIVILFHSHEFIEIDKKTGKFTFQDFIELLTWITSQKDIHVRTIDETTQVIRDLDSHRFINYASYVSSSLYRLSPNFLKKSINPIIVYPSVQTLSDMRVKSWLFLTLLYLVSLMSSITITYWAGFHVFSKYKNLGTIAKYASMTAFGLSAAYAFYDFKIYFKGAMMLIILLGASIGIFVSLISIRKQNKMDGVNNFDN